jgi:ATP-dependent Clp protease adapter protein ClpS
MIELNEDTTTTQNPTVIDTPPVLDNQNEEKIDTPKDYHVMLHNDDNTPVNVVVDVLHTVFQMERARSMQIMMAAHNSGKAIVCTRNKDMAETLADKAMALAAQETNPVTRQQVSLKFTAEEA